MQKQAALDEELQLAGFEYGDPLFIRVFKNPPMLETWLMDKETKRFQPFKEYPICKFSGTYGPKVKEGDRQAPEGFYTVTANQMNPWSQYHLSFNLGYPNEYDQAMGRTGNLLMIHGDCKSEGCFALTDPAIEEVYLLTEASIANGSDVPVHIFPFKMHGYNMFAFEQNQWHPFWKNLREGYDAFEATRIPPNISVQSDPRGARYVIETPEQQKIAMY